ncbi:MAG: hypothetical protein A2139_02925 [Desulfobacca sp. RBG_16_60_12]|nr:MAG: hypothetical protein A2139_02925 [Desulfobacca sp. RBG_16_60_12]
MLTSRDTVKPVGKQLLVRPLEAMKISKGGIVIPDTAKNKPLLGKVIAVGDGLSESKYVGKWPPTEIGIEVGTTVIFDRFAGVELPVDDLPEIEFPRLIHIDEVRGVLEGRRKSG